MADVAAHLCSLLVRPFGSHDPPGCTRLLQPPASLLNLGEQAAAWTLRRTIQLQLLLAEMATMFEGTSGRAAGHLHFMCVCCGQARAVLVPTQERAPAV